MRRAHPLRRTAGIAIALAALLRSAAAAAHLDSTGMGPVYDGLWHFLASPEDTVPVLALALLAGLRGAAHGRRALLTLPAAWLLGMLLGLTASAPAGGALVPAFSLMLLGGLVATDAGLSLRLTTALAALLGLVHGFANGAGMTQTGSAVATAAGLVCAAFVLIALAAAFVVGLRTPWARIAVRVAGSWIAASGFLMLGWALRAA